MRTSATTSSRDGGRPLGAEGNSVRAEVEEVPYDLARSPRGRYLVSGAASPADSGKTPAPFRQARPGLAALPALRRRPRELREMAAGQLPVAHRGRGLPLRPRATGCPRLRMPRAAAVLDLHRRGGRDLARRRPPRSGHLGPRTRTRPPPTCSAGSRPAPRVRTRSPPSAASTGTSWTISAAGWPARSSRCCAPTGIWHHPLLAAVRRRPASPGCGPRPTAPPPRRGGRTRCRRSTAHGDACPNNLLAGDERLGSSSSTSASGWPSRSASTSASSSSARCSSAAARRRPRRDRRR